MEQFEAMLDDELLQIDFRRGFFKLTKKGKEEYLIVHGEYPRNPRHRRPAMIKYD